MLLDHIGQGEAAGRVRAGLLAALRGDVRPRDLGGQATTQEFTDRIIEELE
jgi:tartrate dehydrogenase/decarboxylase/D-malate dehydrogenase